MDRQPLLYPYELYTVRRGTAAGRWLRGTATTTAMAAATAAAQELSPSHDLVRPLEYQMQEPNIPCGEIPHFEDFVVLLLN